MSFQAYVSSQSCMRCVDHAHASSSGRTTPQYAPSYRNPFFSCRPACAPSQARSIISSATKQERRRPQPQGETEGSEAEEQQGQKGFLKSGAALVNTLLFGAASRIERGTSVCVSCRGTGTMFCKECEATGIVKSKKSGKDSGRMKSLMGKKSQEKEFIVSNRCRACRGHGRLECPHCEGIGKRNIVSKDQWL